MELEARLALLEQELARLRERVTRSPFDVVDADGRTRAAIEITDKGTSLRFFGKSGKVALSIGVEGTDCGFIGISNAEGTLVGKLDVEQYGARLELHDSYWNTGSAVIIHGNDCDNAGGWVRILAPKKEVFVNAEGTEYSDA